MTTKPILFSKTIREGINDFYITQNFWDKKIPKELRKSILSNTKIKRKEFISNDWFFSTIISELEFLNCFNTINKMVELHIQLVKEQLEKEQNETK